MRKANRQFGSTAILALSAALIASCAEVEAEVPEAQVTQKGVSFHGMGRGDGWNGEVAATQTFTLSSANLSWVKDLNSKIYLTQIDLRPASGVEDLSFIHYARAVMAGDHKTMPVELVNYVRPDHQDEIPVLEAKSPHPVDISQAWAADKVLVTVTVAGRLPERPWSVDVTLYLSGKMSYKL